MPPKDNSTAPTRSISPNEWKNSHPPNIQYSILNYGAARLNPTEEVFAATLGESENNSVTNTGSSGAQVESVNITASTSSRGSKGGKGGINDILRATNTKLAKENLALKLQATDLRNQLTQQEKESEDNVRLVEENLALKLQVADLQKQVRRHTKSSKDYDHLAEENVALKLQITDLRKQLIQHEESIENNAQPPKENLELKLQVAELHKQLTKLAKSKDEIRKEVTIEIATKLTPQYIDLQEQEEALEKQKDAIDLQKIHYMYDKQRLTANELKVMRLEHAIRSQLKLPVGQTMDSIGAAAYNRAVAELKHNLGEKEAAIRNELAARNRQQHQREVFLQAMFNLLKNLDMSDDKARKDFIKKYEAKSSHLKQPPHKGIFQELDPATRAKILKEALELGYYRFRRNLSICEAKGEGKLSAGDPLLGLLQDPNIPKSARIIGLRIGFELAWTSLCKFHGKETWIDSEVHKAPSNYITHPFGQEDGKFWTGVREGKEKAEAEFEARLLKEEKAHKELEKTAMQGSKDKYTQKPA
ncbi:hypothetical protein GQ43DRAFT_463052 [Delitschia confertaspora ATCC 74209]|uniref:Uncharacterized protein n=1 Tax=Delitschia confertaspora ATCC 74209 TaxID=1513339 RepID=A0A9P4JLH0_9PLEO|nr:hypothetical protein GQ43DRAFT_463052 [Delitschia confertaspora ATCC 74209]